MIRYPAEWEPQERIWLTWPDNSENWRSRPGIVDFYADLIGIIRRFQPVALIVPDAPMFPPPPRISAPAPHPLERIVLITDDLWIRDYGPLFVEADGAKQIVTFAFNAWGQKYPPWDHDNGIPHRIGDRLGVPVVEKRIVFEGGAIEADGQGAGITTMSCLVGTGRNTPDALDDVEETILTSLGLDDLLVLEAGLEGDHTDGHIDNVARFLSSEHVVVAREDDPRSPNHATLAEARARLETWRPHGRTLKVSTLPLPPQRRLSDAILPASYMNFIFVNGGLIVPTYGAETDQEALDFFKAVYPDREIVGIDARLVIEEGGSLHCLSRQEPAATARR